MGSITLTALTFLGLFWVIQCRELGPPMLKFADILQKEEPYKLRAENGPYPNEVDLKDEPMFLHPAALKLLSSQWTSPNKGQFAPFENAKPFLPVADPTEMKLEAPSGILKIFPILPKLTELIDSSPNSMGITPPTPAAPTVQDQSYRHVIKASGPHPEPPIALPPSIRIRSFFKSL